MSIEDMFRFGQQALASQPFSCFMGATLTAFSSGHAELSIPIRPDLLQQHGYVHGGVLSYAADNALTFAGGSVLGPSILTSEFKINYVRPAQGERLVARASVIGAGSRQAVCRCDVWTVAEGKETLCATALGTVVRTGP